MPKKYEALFIFAGNVREDDLETVLSSSVGEIEKLGAKIESSEIIGRRPFARTMQKQTHGNYAKVRFEIDPSQVASIHDRFKHNDDCFRLQIVTRNERIEAAKAADDARRAAFKAKNEANAAADIPVDPEDDEDFDDDDSASDISLD